MLKIARKKYPKIKFLQGDISSFQFKEKFDKIICTYSLSMVEHLEKTIKNVAKYLKNNGLFLILDFHSWRGLIKPFYQIFRKWLSFHGVNSNKNYILLLEKNFKTVNEKILNSGYNSIIIAKYPK